MARSGRPIGRDRIVDATLELAEAVGWDGVRLHQVAEQLNLPLAELRAEFPDLDAVANAWFARALDQTLRVPAVALPDRAPPERLEVVIMRWLEVLAAHRRVTREMLGAKLYPGHPQHWLPLIFDLSRLIHWFLDAARIRSTGRQRQLAEIGLTLIVLRTLWTWLRDESPGQVAARDRVRRQLQAADRWLTWRTSTADKKSPADAGGGRRTE